MSIVRAPLFYEAVTEGLITEEQVKVWCHWWLRWLMEVYRRVNVNDVTSLQTVVSLIQYHSYDLKVVFSNIVKSEFKEDFEKLISKFGELISLLMKVRL